MRLLWLTPEAPDPGGTGGGMRLHQQVAGLARLGVELTVVAPAHDDQAQRAAGLLDDGVTLRLVRRPDGHVSEAARAVLRRPGLTLAAARLPWLSWQAEVFWGEIAGTVADVLDRGGLDGVIVEHDFAMAWAGRLPPRLPAGLVFQNTQWTYYRNRRAGARGLTAARLAAEERRFQRLVHRHAPRYSHGWAMSDPERDEIAAMLPGLPVDVVPNGVDGAHFGDLPIAGGEPDTLLFTGTMSYPPNAEAVSWFVREVLPLVCARRPDVRLSVVGRGAPPAVARLAEDPAIEVLGWVDDLRPRLSGTAVSIAPIRSGSGTNLKVVEALAAGRPLVATPLAAAGIDVRPGTDLLVAGDPDEFARAVVRLLEDRELAERLAASGRERVLARYDWSAMARVMHASLERWLRI